MEGGPTKMTADILHAGFNIFNSFKKIMQLNSGERTGQKNPDYIKMSHIRSTMAVKIRGRVISLEHHFSVTQKH